jgi:hypothetical protein
MTIWSLTINKIQQDNPLSIRLLQLMSFLDPDEIPHSLMQSAMLPEARKAHYILAPLFNFALLTRLGSSNYRLYRLVSFWTRVQMTSEVKYERMETAVTLMSQSFPFKSYESFAEYSPVLPHAVSVLKYLGSEYPQFGSSDSSLLHQNVARYL